jgi:hypothetical protein
VGEDALADGRERACPLVVDRRSTRRKTACADSGSPTREGGAAADHGCQRRRRPRARLLTEQCLSTHAGPPLLPGAETSFLQIVQTRDSVVLAAEASNDARIVALDGRPHLLATLRSWRGDSRGRWEGDTLIVDSSNIRLNETLTVGLLAASDATSHLVERFTLLNIDTLQYQFTVNAPTIFVAPWTGVMTMKRTTSRMFEYARHEGNYALKNILTGARAEEAKRSPSLR